MMKQATLLFICMLKSWTLLLFSTITLLLFCQAANASYKAYLKSGISAYKAGKLSTAKRSFEAAIGQSPSSDLAHYYLANTLFKLGLKSKAIKEYKKAYQLARTTEMTRNCAHVLKKNNIKLPPRAKESMSVRSARANMTPYSVKSLDEITKSLGKGSSVKLKDSHAGGPKKFASVPETQSGLKEKWDLWIQNFRISFNRNLHRQLGRASFALWGSSKVVFSVDKQRRLRSRIVSSSAPYFWDHYILETTRKMDRSSILNFPRGSAIDGFNFSMGWNNGPTKRSMSRSTMIELQRIQAKLNRNPLTGTRAIAKRLNTKRVRSSISSSKVSAKLNSNSAKGELSSQKPGKLSLPSFKTSVSSMILPKPKELKATQHKIEPKDKK